MSRLDRSSSIIPWSNRRLEFAAAYAARTAPWNTENYVEFILGCGGLSLGTSVPADLKDLNST
jgi:hypothetical protein